MLREAQDHVAAYMRTSLQPERRKLEFKWCAMVSKFEATTTERKAVQVTGF